VIQGKTPKNKKRTMAAYQDVVSAKAGGVRYQNNNDSSSSQSADVDNSIDLGNELIDTSKVDDVLTRKMALVNAAIDEIGMTPFQWKLFFLNGFGYAVDSVSVLPSVLKIWVPDFVDKRMKAPGRVSIYRPAGRYARVWKS
jgi:hypothetical protein